MHSTLYNPIPATVVGKRIVNSLLNGYDSQIPFCIWFTQHPTWVSHPEINGRMDRLPYWQDYLTIAQSRLMAAEYWVHVLGQSLRDVSVLRELDSKGVETENSARLSKLIATLNQRVGQDPLSKLLLSYVR